MRLATALAMAVTVALAAPQAIAQGPKPPAGGGAPMGEADKKAYQAFTKKAADIQKKYGPQMQSLQKKYKPDMDTLQKKYKPQMAAAQKEAQGLKPEDQKGPKGQAAMKKLMDLQKKMMSEPAAKKMIGEIKPVVKKMTDEILAAAPAKLKPIVKQQIDMQMKQLGG